MKQGDDPLSEDNASALGALIFESSPDCMNLLDLDGNIAAVNRNGRCLMEIDDFRTVAGLSWQSLWPEASHADIRMALADARGGGTGRFSAYGPTANGAPKWWDVIVTPVRARNGQIEKLLAVSRDVTAAHQASLELQASEARFRSLVTATSAIVWCASASGQFETEQASWAAFTGQTLEQYKGWRWLDAVHPGDQAQTLATWRQAVETHSLYQVEHRLRCADGQYRHMLARAVPIVDAAGNISEWVGVHTDISTRIQANAERERLLKEVQASNNRLLDVFRQAPAFMCVLSGPDHVFEMINERYFQLVGNRDLVGQPVRQALPEIEGQGFFELLDRVFQTGEPFMGVDMPVRLKRSPGSTLEERFIDFVFMALRDADGSVTGLLVHGVDQTHRKLAEMELFQSRERLEKIVSQAATGVVQMDTDGRITLVNQKYCDMLGYAEAELLGMNVIDVTAPDSVPMALDAIDKVIACRQSLIMEKQYRRKDGSLMSATSSLNALRGQGGEYQGLVAIVLDTTAAKRAAEELRASEERYRTLFESMDQGFCILEMIFDPAGAPMDYRFLEMNGMFEEHTGLVNAIGKTARELVPDLDSFWFETYGRVAITGESVRFESAAEAMGRWFEVYATRIGGPDSNKVALLFSDITARKRADENLRQLAADLSEEDRRKTEFLATLAHELRNPLAPIRSGLSAMRLGGGSHATATKVLEMMERQVTHMVRLIDDLLDVARISGGKLDLRKEPVELKQVLSSAVETSLPLIEAGQHELIVDVADEPLPVEVDATRIAQVVANLLNNAAKYTPSRGRIRLSARQDGGEVVISVADTGIGIPEEALATVFVMFAQVGRDVNRAQGGLGIGLSLVRRLVEMHGGTVAAASAGIGKGSTFTVRLPLAPDAIPGNTLAAPQQHSTDATGAKGLKVLVVDDNEDAAITLSMILEVHGHTTEVAYDGLQAIAAAREFKPAVAFLDIGLPRMNGYEVARAMRKIPELAHVVLIALTGWGAESDRALSKEAGFDHHLTKPVELATVQTLLVSLADSLRETPDKMQPLE